MSLDLSTAKSVEPEQIAGIGELKSLVDAPSTTPRTLPNIQVFTWSPVTEAGVNLAKVVLAIITGTIVILFVYLSAMDYFTGSDLAAIYGKVINPNKIGEEIYTLSQLERMIQDMGTLKGGTDVVLPDGAMKNVQNVIKFVSNLQSVPESDKVVIKKCDTIPSDTSRDQFLETCINAVSGLRKLAIDASSGISDAQVAGEYASKVVEERASLHSFWVQTTQLILLNLLLPVLTALLGYVFGTQQGNSRSSV